MEPLIERPKAGEPIIFDEEEQRVIESEMERQLELAGMKDKVFPKDVAEQMWRIWAWGPLEGLARSRLESKDFKGAASTCIKLLGVYGELKTSSLARDWLLLAEIFAEYGDTKRAKNFIDVAKKTYSQRIDKKIFKDDPLEKFMKGKNIDKIRDEMWNEEIERVQGIIRSKESKLHK